MKEVTVRDGQGARWRRYHTIVRLGDELHMLVHTGRIPAYAPHPRVVVLQEDYKKVGQKWSHSTWTIAVPDAMEVISFRDGWETGTWTEGLDIPADTWPAWAERLHVSIDSVQQFLRVNMPEIATRIDETEAALLAVALAEGDCDEISVTFGSPTNRQLAAGFWGWPIVVRKDGQVIATITSDGSTWISDSERVRVLAAKWRPGYHGGSITVKIAAPAGCEAQHEQPK
jgi:hypothetical protein